MLITRDRVFGCLDRFLSDRDKEHIQLITDLSWLAAVVLEYGFHCKIDKAEETKNKFFEIIQKLTEARKSSKIGRIKRDSQQFSTFGDKALSLEDFSLVCDLFYQLTEKDKKVSSNQLKPWLEEAWDRGVAQRKVYDMKIEGCVMNSYGIFCSFGADLAMFGRRKGLIPT